MTRWLFVGYLFASIQFLSAQSDGQGLVAFYSFNGCDRTDHTAINPDIRLLGGVGCWCGIDQDGLIFSGGTDYALLDGPLNRYFSTSDLTVSFYLRVWDTNLMNQVVLSTRDPERSAAGWEAVYDPVSHLVSVHLFQDSIRRYQPVEVPLDTGKWHHLSFVREGNEVRGYHNGLLIDQVRRCRNIDISNDIPLHLGRPAGRPGPDRMPFKGMIDELRIFSTPFSGPAVRQLYLQHPVEEARWDCYSAERPVPFDE